MLNPDNFILLSDSYKQTHDPMYPEGTDGVYSYFESRVGAEFPDTVFVGLQAILKKYFVGVVVTQQDIEEAAIVCAAHFGTEDLFNRKMWEHIVNEHGGKLPLEIKAVREGLRIPTGNVLLTVRNTGGEITRGLVSHAETIITHVWFPSTVATKSRHIKDILEGHGKECGFNFIDFHLHDFGMRGTSSMESAAIGGLGHLVNFLGTDTMNALIAAHNYYGCPLAEAGFSVPASEHSVATAEGPAGEGDYLDRMIDNYPNGIVSIVADSYDIEHFVTCMVANRKDKIIERWKNGKAPVNRVVIRPDSPRFKGDTPAAQVIWLHEELFKVFGGEVQNGFKILHPAIGIIYGDGLSTQEIDEIYDTLTYEGWSISNCVVGQGGGLLQKVNRDTQRFAFKCSAQRRNGVVYHVQKNPLDKSKASKSGILKLVKNHDLDGNWKYETVNDHHPLFNDFPDELETVFCNGELLRDMTFAEVRANSNIKN